MRDFEQAIEQIVEIEGPISATEIARHSLLVAECVRVLQDLRTQDKIELNSAGWFKSQNQLTSTKVLDAMGSEEVSTKFLAAEMCISYIDADKLVAKLVKNNRTKAAGPVTYIATPAKYVTFERVSETIGTEWVDVDYLVEKMDLSKAEKVVLDRVLLKAILDEDLLTEDGLLFLSLPA